MVVVVEASAFRWGFFCAIIKVHHRQRATRLSHSSFLCLWFSQISDIITSEYLASFDKYSRTVPGFFSRGFLY
nr:MAG TPA: hypothetical protein [Caudoviricetes sp.]